MISALPLRSSTLRLEQVAKCCWKLQKAARTSLLDLQVQQHWAAAHKCNLAIAGQSCRLLSLTSLHAGPDWQGDG